MSRQIFSRIVAGWLLAVCGSAGGAGPAKVVSTPPSSGLAGGGNSFNPVFSGDGRYVVFLSQANNLVTNDQQQPGLKVFRQDLGSGETRLASVATNGFGSAEMDCVLGAMSSIRAWPAIWCRGTRTR
jgi:hypothetical protein